MLCLAKEVIRKHSIFGNDGIDGGLDVEMCYVLRIYINIPFNSVMSAFHGRGSRF